MRGRLWFHGVEYLLERGKEAQGLFLALDEYGDIHVLFELLVHVHDDVSKGADGF